MKINWSDSVHSRVMFACGTVFGICLGFAGGHLSVWSRAKTHPSGDASGWAWVSDNAYRIPQLQQLGPGGERPDMTAALEPFFGDVVRRRGATPPVDVSAAEDGVRVATETSTAPYTLPDGVRAAPIDEQTRFQEQITRSIIAQEMPQASAAEQEVWFDVLRGLDAADVKGILRMRKHVGAGPGGMAAAPGHVRDPLEGIPEIPLPSSRPAASSSWTETIRCLREVRNIRLHNLCNRDTVGFMKLDPQITDVIEGDERGIRLNGVQRLFDHGEFHDTSRALDVAIDGPGFFQVRWENESRLTRNGRFHLDDERHIALKTTDQSWRLDPPLVVPEKATSLTIHKDGRVTASSIGAKADAELGRFVLVNVLDPTGLRYDSDGLFEITTASGSSFPCDTPLDQYMVERPARSTMEFELISLEREEKLLQDLSQPARDREPGN